MKVNTCPRPSRDHFPLPRRAKDEPPAAPPSHLNAARAEKSRFFSVSSRHSRDYPKGKGEKCRSSLGDFYLLSFARAHMRMSRLLLFDRFQCKFPMG
jgi:hypothetical protein